MFSKIVLELKRLACENVYMSDKLNVLSVMHCF